MSACCLQGRVLEHRGPTCGEEEAGSRTIVQLARAPVRVQGHARIRDRAPTLAHRAQIRHVHAHNRSLRPSEPHHGLPSTWCDLVRTLWCDYPTRPLSLPRRTLCSAVRRITHSATLLGSSGEETKLQRVTYHRVQTCRSRHPILVQARGPSLSKVTALSSYGQRRLRCRPVRHPSKHWN